MDFEKILLYISLIWYTAQLSRVCMLADTVT